MKQQILLEKPQKSPEPLYLDSLNIHAKLGKVVCYVTRSRKRIAVLTQFREKNGTCYYGFKYLDRLFMVDGCEMFFEGTSSVEALTNAFEKGDSGHIFFNFTSLTEFLFWAEAYNRGAPGSDL